MLNQTLPVADAHTIQSNSAMPQETLVRRTSPDRSQQMWRAAQFAFLGFNVWIGIQFTLWLRFYESQCRSVYFERSAGVDGWLPIAGLMNLRCFLVTGPIPEIHLSEIVPFFVFLLASLLVRKSSSAWLCPIGTLSQYLWKLRRKLIGRSISLPKWLDMPLRSVKCQLLAFPLVIVFTMPSESVGISSDLPLALWPT